MDFIVHILHYHVYPRLGNKQYVGVGNSGINRYHGSHGNLYDSDVLFPWKHNDTQRK